MPHLVIRTPDGTKTEFILDGRSLVIGREDTCDLHFADGQVSRQHSRIIFDDGEYWIEDMGSANGTIINGTRIEQPTLLKKNNIIDISGFHLTYRTNTEDTQITYALVGQRPPVDNQTFILPVGSLQVGRSDDNAIVLNDNSMSRNHAVILVTLKGMTVEDLGSSNGSFVNGTRIQSQALVPGDLVRFGNVEFAVSQMGEKGIAKAAQQFLSRLNNADRSVKLAIGIAALSGILLVGTISIALRQNIQAKSGGEAESVSLQATYESAIARYLVEARNFMQKEEWQPAAESFHQVITRDPINKESRKGLQAAQDNLTHQVMIQAAKTSLRKNNAEDVIRKVQDIPSSAHYSFEAQALHRAAVQLIVDSSLDKSVRACSSRKWKTCHQLAVKILMNAPAHQQAQELAREAEKQMKRSRIAYRPWTSSP